MQKWVTKCYIYNATYVHLENQTPFIHCWSNHAHVGATFTFKGRICTNFKTMLPPRERTTKRISFMWQYFIFKNPNQKTTFVCANVLFYILSIWKNTDAPHHECMKLSLSQGLEKLKSNSKTVLAEVNNSKNNKCKWTKGKDYIFWLTKWKFKDF